MSVKMRTRCINSMVNWEVEEYLKRNDIVIVPVGTNELHGPCPLDCEYVMAEAFARLIAEQVDGLVLPNLIYYHPGATQIGRGTVHMSMSDGFRHITAIMDSLLNQGFRRQVYIPAHEPTSQFLLAACTEFFDTHKVPVLHLNVMNVLDKAGAFPYPPIGKIGEYHPVSTPDAMGDFAVMTAAYKICNRLQDFPCGAETNRPEILDGYPHEDPCWDPLFRIINAGTTRMSVSPAFYFSDPCEHGFGALPETREEIEREAEIGEAFLKETFQKYDFNPMMEDLRTVDRYQNTTIMEKYGDRLPKNRWSDNKVRNL